MANPTTTAEAIDKMNEDLRKPGRWMLYDRAGAPYRHGGRHVLIEGARASFARTLAARWLVSKGVDLDAADVVQVREWKPNGWLPPRVVLLSAVDGGALERHLEANGA
jgi:hypothetical protein